MLGNGELISVLRQENNSNGRSKNCVCKQNNQSSSNRIETNEPVVCPGFAVVSVLLLVRPLCRITSYGSSDLNSTRPTFALSSQRSWNWHSRNLARSLTRS
ncbi:hypothetical protein J6590_080160 [Homalodisca vitripennis]|nr:hypothetical protein J6590_080160 [Homalodisca vitripennis]